MEMFPGKVMLMRSAEEKKAGQKSAF